MLFLCYKVRKVCVFSLEALCKQEIFVCSVPTHGYSHVGLLFICPLCSMKHYCAGKKKLSSATHTVLELFWYSLLKGARDF